MSNAGRLCALYFLTPPVNNFAFIISLVGLIAKDDPLRWYQQPVRHERHRIVAHGQRSQGAPGGLPLPTQAPTRDRRLHHRGRGDGSCSARLLLPMADADTREAT